MKQPARRDVLTHFALSGLGLAGLGLAGCARSRMDTEEPPQPGLPAGTRLLFQGDSITDAGRDRTSTEANEPAGLGQGYAWMAASTLLAQQPEDGLAILNRGVSGDRVPSLHDRWQADCLALEPDVLSILIGVNDIWHKIAGTYKGSAESYEADYLALLERTRAALPEVHLILCEPFVLRCGFVDESWFPDFEHYRAAAERVAQIQGATWVPFQAKFDEALSEAPPEHWAADGVHPSEAGAALMARTWLEAVTG